MKANQMIAYALKFIGIPYIWGGNHPALGYDCSGFIQEILSSVGLDPKGDQSAQTLYIILKQGTWKEGLQPGALLFFGKSEHLITHVALQVDSHHMIEAGGGGSSTRTKEDAIKSNAFIRIRPIANRSDLINGLYYIGE